MNIIAPIISQTGIASPLHLIKKIYTICIRQISHSSVSSFLGSLFGSSNCFRGRTLNAGLVRKLTLIFSVSPYFSLLRVVFGNLNTFSLVRGLLFGTSRTNIRDGGSMFFHVQDSYLLLLTHYKADSNLIQRGITFYPI